jgi:hypothetical protein
MINCAEKSSTESSSNRSAPPLRGSQRPAGRSRAASTTRKTIPHPTSPFSSSTRKTYQQKYGFSYTDANGAYLTNFLGTGEKPSSPTLYIQVANQSAKAVFLASTAFQPASGSITYQNITIAAQPLGDPPDAVRKIAFPPHEATS